MVFLGWEILTEMFIVSSQSICLVKQFHILHSVWEVHIYLPPKYGIYLHIKFLRLSCFKYLNVVGESLSCLSFSPLPVIKTCLPEWVLLFGAIVPQALFSRAGRATPWPEESKPEKRVKLRAWSASCSLDQTDSFSFQPTCFSVSYKKTLDLEDHISSLCTSSKLPHRTKLFAVSPCSYIGKCCQCLLSCCIPAGRGKAPCVSKRG